MTPSAPPGALAPLGWDERVATLARSAPAADRAGTVPARVVRVDRDRALVVTDAGSTPAAADPLPAVGDWVLVRDRGPATAAAVVAVLPRRTELARVDPRGTRQVLAANVDVVAVCHPLDRPSANRVERELVLAWESGATPVVVCTKADARPDAGDAAADLSARLTGVDVLLTSSTTGQGLGDVAALARPHRTLVLVGPSGAGKSTLVNRLLGDGALATGAVRAADHRGRHTTTARHLLALPGGGVLIDTPGLRSLALTGDDRGLAAAFPDVEELAAGCRFDDCAHASEPGCAVRAAVEDGRLDPARAASWRKLDREAAHARRAEDARARAEHRAEVRRIHREVRRGRRRPGGAGRDPR